MRRWPHKLAGGALVGLAVILATPALAQVPVSDNARQTQAGQTNRQTDQIKQSAKRWLTHSAGVRCGMMNDRASSTVDAYQRTEITNLIRKYAQQYGVRQEFAFAVAMQESRFSQNVRSCAGAIGVMQLMPRTAAALGVDPYDLEDNIKGGVKYLREQLIRFNGSETLAAAAYNAGPDRASLRAGNVPNIPETQTYVKQIFGRWEPQFKVIVGSSLPGAIASANSNLIDATRNAAGSIGGMQALASDRMAAIKAEGAKVGGAGRAHDAWEDNSQARIIVGQSLNQSINQGAIIGALQVARLIAELANQSQTTKAMSYSPSPPATPTPIVTVTPSQSPLVTPRPNDPNACTPPPGQTSGSCAVTPRTTDQPTNVAAYLAGVQEAARSRAWSGPSAVNANFTALLTANR